MHTKWIMKALICNLLLDIQNTGMSLCGHHEPRIWMKTVYTESAWVRCSRCKMCKSALCLVCVSLLLGPSLSCYQCFVEVQDSLRLCWGHILTEHNVRNVDSCFRKLDRIFNNHERVIEAGRVGTRLFFYVLCFITKDNVHSKKDGLYFDVCACSR